MIFLANLAVKIIFLCWNKKREGGNVPSLSTHQSSRAGGIKKGKGLAPPSLPLSTESSIS
jgi:hypothetical protein